MRRRDLIFGASAALAAPVTGLAAEFKRAPEGRVPIPAIRPSEIPLPPPAAGREVRARFGLSGQSGWLAVDLDNGRVLDGFGAEERFAPASVAKLPTALFAMDKLGGGHRFETTLEITGEVRGEGLAGNVVLKGAGDPELDSDALVPLVLALKELGIREVSGAFLVDDSAILAFPEIDPAQPAEAPYNPGLSGLNLNFNRARLRWGKSGIDVLAWAERLRTPANSLKVVAAAAEDARLFSHRFQGNRELWQMSRRALRRPGERWLPVKAPALYAGETFRHLAQTYGIALPGPQRAATQGARVIARHRSRPLAAMLRDMLRFSTNITAEAVGAAASGAGSAADSAGQMNAWAAGEAGFASGDPGFAFVNHSGLSTQSRVSPQRMVALLQALARRSGGTHARLPGAAAGLLKRHNVASEDLPLDYDRLEVVSKTGTMNFIRGLAGYVATPGGRRLAFAVFSNDLPRRGFGEGLDRRWMGRARGFERALIRNWVLMADGKS
ncbi:MAG: D-alanyl-D-alanine carboxypeptidase/D-alanyl-D-alanine-endopeptidase [Pseudomonadota bacterium]